jgi:hypothetical protein
MTTPKAPPNELLRDAAIKLESFVHQLMPTKTLDGRLQVELHNRVEALIALAATPPAEPLRTAALDLAREFLEVYETQHGTMAGVAEKARAVEVLAATPPAEPDDVAWFARQLDEAYNRGRADAATPPAEPKSPFRAVTDELTGGDGCACHTGLGYNTSCQHCRPATPPAEPLDEERLKRAMQRHLDVTEAKRLREWCSPNCAHDIAAAYRSLPAAPVKETL